MTPYEIIARAIYERSGFALSGCMDAMMRHDADVHDAVQYTITALATNGYAIVPIEPSPFMLETAWSVTGESHEMRERTELRMAGIYRAMIAARDI